MGKLAVAIQHHPARAELLPPLLRAMSPATCLIARDPDPDGRPNAWRTYRRALELAPRWASHLLVLQDDVTPSRWLAISAPRVAESRPDALVALFVGGRPQEAAGKLMRACAADRSLVEIGARRWVPVVALIWPTAAIPAALEFVDSKRWPERFCADDEIVGHIARELELEVWATVPSLVEHEDVTASLVGRRARGGQDRGRVAACFIRDEDDSRAIIWA